MNGTSGFQEVRSSTPRLSSNRLLCEQQSRFGTGSWHHLQTSARTVKVRENQQGEVLDPWLSVRKA